MSSFEIEIKTLLGAKENADALRTKILEKYGSPKMVATKQLNHYFMGGDMAKFKNNFVAKIALEKLPLFEKIITEGKKLSVRTRRTDTDTILVVKASIDDSTSSNGVARLEFEEKLPMTLDELDKLLLDSGFTYQAKWSREREEYIMPDLPPHQLHETNGKSLKSDENKSWCGGVHICIDKNAGYGYLVEFEKVVTDASQSDEVQKSLRHLMTEFGVEELPQDRLERMFAHYNANWQNYYGTENVFTIL